MSLIKATVDGKTLTIVMELEEPRASASGKTLVVASTRGNATTDVLVNGSPLVVGVNAYIKFNPLGSTTG